MPKNTVKYTTLFLCILQLIAVTVFSQKTNIDSLKKILATQKEDTSKLHILAKICTGFFEAYSWDSIASYAQAQFTLAKKINSPKEIAVAYKSLGLSDYGINKFEGAFENFSIALRMMKEIDDPEGIATTSWLLGKINYQLGQYSTALKNVRTALEIVQSGDNTALIAGCYYDHGLYYEVLHDYTQSLKYYYLALRMYEKLGITHFGKDKYFSVMSNTYCSIGNICILQDNSAEALHNLTLAQEHREQSSRKVGLGYIANCFGEVYFKQGNYAMALQKQFDALELWKKYADLAYQSWAIPHTYRDIGHIYRQQGEDALQVGKKDTAQKYLSLALANYTASLNGYTNATDKSGIPAANVNLGKLYLVLKNTKQAGFYLEKGLQLSIAAGDRENVRESYLSISQLDSMRGNFNQAYEKYKKYILCRDSLVNEESLLKSESYKLQYEFEKKDDEIKLLSAESKLQSLSAKEQKQKKNIAYLSAAVLLLLGGYIFYRFSKRKRAQSIQAMMNERLRISTDLHDEVGATLSGIAMYSHLTREQIKVNNISGVENSLHVMQQSSSHMVNKLNDIVWFINPDQDSLKQLVNRLEDYAVSMGAIKGIKVTTEVPSEFNDLKMTGENRRNIYLFCKEAINNAVKYSDATFLELIISETDGKMQFSVKDDGKGFDEVLVRRGNGLENMQKRADELDAEYMLQSKPGFGTTISLKLKYLNG
ncbi:MAG: tetratricopeptide repeat protein [Bacteroidota bacterium]